MSLHRVLADSGGHSMSLKVIDRDEALEMVKSLLSELSPDTPIALSSHEGTLVLQWRKGIDPGMVRRVEANFDRFDDVFSKLAQ